MPGTPTGLITTSVGPDVKIEWDATDDGGTEITGFVVQVLSIDGETFFEDTVNCPSDDPIIIETRECYIPNKVLNAAPFNLLWGSSVLAKVRVLNIVGPSAFSFVGNGAVLLNGPSAPLNLAENRALTTSYTIGLTW